mgnify:CR=1 FL=1
MRRCRRRAHGFSEGRWTPAQAAEFAARRARVDAALLAARELRPQPALDDKILAGWNGLMISAFARGGRILHDPDLPARAEAAA